MTYTLYTLRTNLSYHIVIFYQVRSDIKLPVLYLIDSIVKNVNGDYLNLFTQNIVNTFCGVFEKVRKKYISFSLYRGLFYKIALVR